MRSTIANRRTPDTGSGNPRMMLLLILATVSSFCSAFTLQTPISPLASSLTTTNELTKSRRQEYRTVSKHPLPLPNGRILDTTRLNNVISKDNQDQVRFMYMNKEQDELLQEKGNYEESCMKKPTPLKANKIRNTSSTSGSGIGGGFGGGGGGVGKKKKGGKKQKGVARAGGFAKSGNGDTIDNATTENDAALVSETQQHAQRLMADGLVRIDNVLDPKLCDDLRDYLIDLRSRATADLESGLLQDSQERFADVLLNQNRCDLKIPLGPLPVLNALHHLLSTESNDAIVRRVMEYVYEKYGSNGSLATLYELNCFMSNSGARRQLVHADSVCLEHTPGLKDASEPIMLTCFIALQDTDATMGPTIWIPGTHNMESHHVFFETGEQGEESTKTDTFSPKEKLLKSKKSVVGTLPKGACVIFDPRTLHCAGANTCDEPGKTRALFYMSFKNPKVDFPGSPSTSGYGIVNADLTIQNLANELEADQNGEASIRLKSVSCFP